MNTFALLLLTLVGAPQGEPLVIPAGREAEVLRLIEPLELGGPVAAGYRLANIAIDPHSFNFYLERDGRSPVEWRLAPIAGPPGHRVSVEPAEADLDADAKRALDRLREVVLPRADADFWSRVLVAGDTTDATLVGRAAFGRPWGLPWGLPWAVALFALVGVVLLDVRGRTVLTLPAVLLATAPILAWYAVWQTVGAGLEPGQVERWLQLREKDLAELFFYVAVGSIIAAAVAAVRSTRRREIPGGANPWRVDAALGLDTASVFVWSVVVRFGLTAANILTDGGSGWSRLLDHRRGFGGVAVLVDLVLPDRSMWDSILVPRLAAALSPPILVLLARAVGAGRRTSLFSGLALASLPLHAALYSSDFESGAVVTILLAGLTLVAVAARTSSAPSLAAGLAVIAFGLWGRPEALVVGLPLLALMWAVPSRLWSRPSAAAAVAWIGSVALVRLVTLSGLANGSRDNLLGPWGVLPLDELLTTSAILPYWLWVPVPLGLLCLRGRARALAVVGLVAGLVPVHVTPTMFDPTETYLEFFRYGSFALPWLALLAGAGIAYPLTWLSRRTGWGNVANLLGAVVVVMFAATPWINRDYLAIRYGPAVDEDVFRQALTHVPAQCRVVVPDDDLALEVMKRYVHLARDVATIDETTPPPGHIVGISSFLRDWHARGRVRPSGCWYFYRGSYCHDGFEGDPPVSCRELLDTAPFELVWSRSVEYRSHRLVTRPGRTIPPWYERELVLSLYRLD